MAGIISPFLFLADVDSNSLAYQFGRAIPFILTSIGIVKCAQIMRRPTTNTKGVLALMLLLIGWLIAMAAGIAAKGIGESRQLLAIAGLLALVSAVAGVVLAIIAITEMRTQPGRYNQGMKQAVWSLLLSVCIVGLTGAGVYRGMQRDKTEVAALAAPVQPAAGEQVRFEKFNFVFERPAKPWVKTDAMKLSSDACLALMRVHPQIVFQLIAEDATAQLDFSTEMLAEIAIGNMNSAATQSTVVEQKPYKLGAIEGIRIYSRASIGKQSFTYVHWVSAAGGYLYQLITFGRPQDETEVRAAAEDLFARFHIIDQTKLAKSSGPAGLSDYRSDRYGYSIKMAEDGWMAWRDFAEDAPDAEFGARLGLDTCLAVYPVSLLGVDPSLDALFHALLERLDLRPAKARDKRELESSGFKGYAATYRREVERAAAARTWRRDGRATQRSSSASRIRSNHCALMQPRPHRSSGTD